MRDIRQKLTFLYGDKADYALERINDLIANNKDSVPARPALSERDTFVEAYGDSLQKPGEHPLETLRSFIERYTSGAVSNLKICPYYPYTSDDGYSVADYYAISPDMGDWEDIRRICDKYGLLGELVLNHTSKSNEWFQKFLRCEDGYRDFYLTGDPDADHSKVTRPRALPLFTAFETKEGVKNVWTTFSDDQVDVNFHNPDVLLAYLEILIFYAKKGVRLIGLDAVGFIWKEHGTTCMHLEQTHEVIKIMRLVLDACAPRTLLITETNVPHTDNISYFGEGDEAQLVYQFVLPPLTLHSFLFQNASALTKWAQSLEAPPAGCTFYNFLSSHDGIGLRPLEGILDDSESQKLEKLCIDHGGYVNYRYLEDSSEKAYELAITYMDALTHPGESDEIRAKRMVASHAIIVAMQGVPNIYIHSLIGSHNWHDGVRETGIKRRANREKLPVAQVERDIATGTVRKAVIEGLCHLMRVRRSHAAFSPTADQAVLDSDARLFVFVRACEKQEVACVVNVSLDEVETTLPFAGTDLLSDRRIPASYKLQPLETIWVAKKKS